VHCYNAEGITGLRGRPRAGRTPLLNEDRLAGLGTMVETQPDPEQDVAVRWRCIGRKAKIEADFGAGISEHCGARPKPTRSSRPSQSSKRPFVRRRQRPPAP
jgi:hypothetical protein